MILAIFLKAPRPGEVKTRLIPALGAETALAVYRRMAEDVVGRTAPVEAEYEQLLFFAPPGARAEVEAWLPGAAWIEQRGADLGARMSAAFDDAFRRGATGVVLVGADVPSLTRADVRLALASLQDHDLVLGPARDGGYYLVALSRPRPPLFEDVRWGTASVFAATMEKAAALGLTVRILEERRDVDTLDDLRAEWPRLRHLFRGALAEALARAVGAEAPR